MAKERGQISRLISKKRNRYKMRHLTELIEKLEDLKNLKKDTYTLMINSSDRNLRIPCLAFVMEVKGI